MTPQEIAELSQYLPDLHGQVRLSAELFERIRKALAERAAPGAQPTTPTENMRRLRASVEAHFDDIFGPETRAQPSAERVTVPQESTASPQAPVAWRPIETAPKDGTLLLLLIGNDEERCCALEDSAQPTRTIGHNNCKHDGEDCWLFAGWNWEQDHYTEGQGKPIAWQPLPDASPVSEQKDTQPCGHHISLLVKSVESDATLCELCEMRDQRNDAVAMEQQYKSELDALRSEQKDEARETLQHVLTLCEAIAATGGSATHCVEVIRAALQEKRDE